MKINTTDWQLDMLGNTLFLGANVVICTTGDNAVLKVGVITEYDEKTNKVKVTGGNIKRGMWRNLRSVVMIHLPGDNK